MKVDCEIIRHIHLDPGYALLSVQNTFTSMEMFKILDVHKSDRLNGLIFFKSNFCIQYLTEKSIILFVFI
jgi:hypothetical protein